MHVFYLHGFASSPRSAKAAFFRERLAANGVRMHCPDFNEPDFSSLTVSRMIEQLAARVAELPPGDVVLIGSSLGGFVAIAAAARQGGGVPPHPISHLVLLAPAVELEWERWTEVGPGGVQAWLERGTIEVFHHAYGERRRLEFGFYEDAERYHGVRRLSQPTLIFQGRHDESVSPALVARFAGAQPEATLHMLEDGHQLKDSLDVIWRETSRMLFHPSPLTPHPLPL